MTSVSPYIPSSYLCQKLTNFRSLLVYYTVICVGLIQSTFGAGRAALGGITIDLIRAHVLSGLCHELNLGSYIPALLSSLSHKMWFWIYILWLSDGLSRDMWVLHKNHISYRGVMYVDNCVHMLPGEGVKRYPLCLVKIPPHMATTPTIDLMYVHLQRARFLPP